MESTITSALSIGFDHNDLADQLLRPERELQQPSGPIPDICHFFYTITISTVQFRKSCESCQLQLVTHKLPGKSSLNEHP